MGQFVFSMDNTGWLAADSDRPCLDKANKHRGYFQNQHLFPLCSSANASPPKRGAVSKTTSRNEFTEEQFKGQTAWMVHSPVMLVCNKMDAERTKGAASPTVEQIYRLLMDRKVDGSSVVGAGYNVL